MCCIEIDRDISAEEKLDVIGARRKPMTADAIEKVC
jgi:hypothetical protein